MRWTLDAFGPRVALACSFSVEDIVVLDLTKGPGAKELAGAARERGVAVSVLGERTARLVTHMDVDDDGIDRAADVLRALLSR